MSGTLQLTGGWIEVIAGVMFSGKSEELIRRLRRAQIARQRVQIFKPLIDNRFAEDHIVSHSDMRIGSENVGSSDELTVPDVGIVQKLTIAVDIANSDISTVEALKRTLLDAKSLSYSKSGQSGMHMAKVIAQLGIADIVNAKAIVNATGLVGERVVRGEVELGFQQVSELLAVKGIDLIGELPAAVQLNSLFAAGIGAKTPHRDAAQALIAQLNTERARQIMRDNGLTPAAR